MKSKVSFDTDGYPTEEFLTWLKECQRPEDALNAAQEAWRWPADNPLTDAEAAIIGPLEDGDLPYRFATGGWSGNEAIIHALRANLFTLYTWRMSMRGGLHIFVLPVHWRTERTGDGSDPGN